MPCHCWEIIAGHTRIKAAKKLGLTEVPVRYLDLSARFIQPDGRITRAIMSDFLHPTDAGYELMGKAIDDALKAWGL
jgi:lysophospholipase L1-like esterase